MNSSQTVERDVGAVLVKVSDDELIVELTDGRKISVPLAWYPRLLHGTRDERNQHELISRGTGIHWPLLDEDLSVRSILNGFPSGESDSSLKKWLASRK